MGRLTAIVLGSAAGGAFPQWNCRCTACALAWAGDPRVKPRTQTGLAVSAGDGHWTLINASPDLPAQIRATAALHPRNDSRGSPIDAVVLTGAEIDQIAGLLSLRESTPFALYATPASHAAVAANAMFGAMNSMARRAVNPGERFSLSGGIEATSLSGRRGTGPGYRKRDQRRHRTASPGSANGIRTRYRKSYRPNARTLYRRRRRAVRWHAVHR